MENDIRNVKRKRFELLEELEDEFGTITKVPDDDLRLIELHNLHHVNNFEHSQISVALTVHQTRVIDRYLNDVHGTLIDVTQAINASGELRDPVIEKTVEQRATVIGKAIARDEPHYKRFSKNDMEIINNTIKRAIKSGYRDIDVALEINKRHLSHKIDERYVQNRAYAMGLRIRKGGINETVNV